MRIYFLLFSLISLSHAASRVTWTGAGGNGLWSYGPNWDSSIIPTAADDVIINLSGGGNVTVAAPANAASITLSDGPNYLIVQSSVTVGAGGVSVQNPAALILQASQASPFSSAGKVDFNGTNTLIFYTGAITGKGPFNIDTNSTALFPGSGSKVIQGTALYNYGVASITGALVQLEASGQYFNYGTTTVTGSTTFLSQDNSGVVQSKGVFTFSATSATDTLSFQVEANFATGITISSGSVNIQNNVISYGFNSVNAAVTVSGSLSLYPSSALSNSFGTLVISPGGALTVNSGSAVVSSLTLDQGKIAIDGTLTVTSATISGGALSGQGGNVFITTLYVNPANNIPITLNTGLTISGDASINSPAVFLFDQSAVFTFPATSTLNITQPTTFQLIGGNPLITINGSVIVNGDFETYVNIYGVGTYTNTYKTITLQAVTFWSGDITCNSCALHAYASTINAGSVTGDGGWYIIQANPTAVFRGGVNGKSLVLQAGSVSASYADLDEFNITGGSLTLTNMSSFGDFNFFGGTLTSSSNDDLVQITANTSHLWSTAPKTLNAVRITTSFLDLACGVQCTISMTNNAEIVNA